MGSIDRFVAFDVETPNIDNGRMSSIGVSVLENGKIVESYYSLVDPEEHFDSFNSELTGIYEETVAGQPTFPDIWKDIRSLMEEGMIIAHNAQFDMAVMAKCLRDYDIYWKEKEKYMCTCQIGRKLLPDLSDHRLDTICDHYGIQLDHHLAESDARACALLMSKYLEMGFDFERYTRTYNILKIHTEHKYYGKTGFYPPSPSRGVYC